jgi:hypothetical protein
MGESIWIDLEDHLAARILADLGDTNYSDGLTVNACYVDLTDGPPEWRKYRDRYAPPFVIIWSNASDWQIQTLGLAGSAAKVDRQYRLVIYAVVNHQDRIQAARNAKILGQRLERSAYTWPASLASLPADEAGEQIHGLSFSQTRIMTYHDDNGAWYAAAMIPAIAAAEIAL